MGTACDLASTGLSIMAVWLQAHSPLKMMRQCLDKMMKMMSKGGMGKLMRGMKGMMPGMGR